jgi:hypothetical protein
MYTPILTTLGQRQFSYVYSGKLKGCTEQLVDTSFQ